MLTEDNLLWREKCREETIDEPLVFGQNRLVCITYRLPFQSYESNANSSVMSYVCPAFSAGLFLKKTGAIVINGLLACKNFNQVKNCEKSRTISLFDPLISM